MTDDSVGAQSGSATPDHRTSSTDEGPRLGRTAVIVTVALLATVGAFVAGVVLLGGGNEVTITIPAGTGAAVAAGEDVDAVPTLIEVSVGDTLVLVNDDSRPHVVGPWTVLPGAEFRYSFTDAQEFSGACSAHPDNTVRIIAS
jgi:plastocyanin